MSLTLTAIDTQVGGSQISVWIAVTPSGTYTTGGDTLDFTKVLNPNFLAKPFPSRVFTVPPGIYLEEMGGPYTGILDGTSLSTYKMKFYTGGGTEFGNGSNYSANLTLTNFNVGGTTGSKLIIQIVWKTGT